ncbi:NUDIX domain-containing protein [Trichothermofontia sichuanensis B231]|uniref:NUDIX hydrolase n=1 Tax=Trichothermofontia sichuanensis TaxID=3045816 RepID=UPI002248750A|nr:NUDIX domain-containing protein [Trichothermofontia sichuanensis]UZQ54541.1 NUDIX domain-containing protein [Trichothermofontia sichuanensis B231]
MSAIVRLRLATLAFFVQADRVLLIHQMTLPEPDTWDLPGGGVKPEEPLLTALRRKVQEEIGISEFTIDRLLTVAEGFFPNPKVAAPTPPDAPPRLLHTVNLIYQCQFPPDPPRSRQTPTKSVPVGFRGSIPAASRQNNIPPAVGPPCRHWG